MTAPTTQRARRSRQDYAEFDARLAAIMRRNPAGLTASELARLHGTPYHVVEQALYRLEKRGLLLCDDGRGRISIYEHQEQPHV